MIFQMMLSKHTIRVVRGATDYPKLLRSRENLLAAEEGRLDEI